MQKYKKKHVFSQRGGGNICLPTDLSILIINLIAVRFGETYKTDENGTKITPKIHFIDRTNDNSVCFLTVSLIAKILTENFKYTFGETYKYDDFFATLPIVIEKIFNANECVFLFCGIFGHSFFIEVNSRGKYIRLYTSYGSRYNILQWMQKDVPLVPAVYDELSKVDYSYSIKKAEQAKNLFGIKPINDTDLILFIRYIKAFSDAKTADQFDDALENLFGVRSPICLKTGKPISYDSDISERKKGMIIIYQKTN